MVAGATPMARGRAATLSFPNVSVDFQTNLAICESAPKLRCGSWALRKFRGRRSELYWPEMEPELGDIESGLFLAQNLSLL